MVLEEIYWMGDVLLNFCNFFVRAEGVMVIIVVSLPCTAYLCGSLIVFCSFVFNYSRLVIDLP